MNTYPEDNLVVCLHDLYDQYRTALMNREYYGCRLASARTWNRALEVVIAIGTSSVVANWAIWKTETSGVNQTGELVWASIAAVATLLTIIKPIINYPKNIERYSKLYVGHGDVYFDLDRVVKRVRRVEDFDEEAFNIYDAAMQRIRDLAADDDPRPNEKLLNACFEEVNLQIPVDKLWLPER